MTGDDPTNVALCQVSALLKLTPSISPKTVCNKTLDHFFRSNTLDSVAVSLARPGCLMTVVKDLTNLLDIPCCFKHLSFVSYPCCLKLNSFLLTMSFTRCCIFSQAGDGLGVKLSLDN